jgi:hypothetical protein
MPSQTILDLVDPLDRLRTAGKRVADPLEAFAQRVAERVIDLVVNALDLNALVMRIDMNALLEQIDINQVILAKIDMNALLEQVDVTALLDRTDLNQVLSRVDLGALLDRIDVNELVGRIDMDALVEQTDLGAIIARSSGGIATEAMDAARSGAVGLDQAVDSWMNRLFWRKRHRPAAPRAMLDGEAQP